jgi:exopolysaccharide biosynthesis protein
MLPYRYLDVTEILQQAGARWQSVGDRLEINLPQTQLNTIRLGNQSWGKRIVVELDRPTFWQVSQAKQEGVVIVQGIPTPQLRSQFEASPSSAPSVKPEMSDDLGGGSGFSENTKLFRLESTGQITKIRVNLPPSHGLRVFSLPNPYRLVIDVRPDAAVERKIQWAPGVIWRQKWVTLGSRGSFMVNLLEIDPKSSQISLKPITPAPNTLTGIAPLMTIARNNQAIAAINGGFFNRNRKQPLGAIRADNQWLSGPILNRGVIAWNRQGEVKMGRLTLLETVIIGGNRFPVTHLNSAYVKKGIARYTSQWGANYIPLTDNEIIILVSNNQIIRQFNAGKAGKQAYPIPQNGYLLTVRANAYPVSNFGNGQEIRLESRTIDQDFANYPYIMGAGPLLLQNGRIVLNAQQEKFSKGFETQKASRSAIATTSQGKILLVAVHNRRGGRGATLGEFALILQQLGALQGLNLDGGSSTSLYLGGYLIDRSPVTAARVHNGIGIFWNP